MKTVVLKIDRKKPDVQVLAQAADVLRRGGVIVFPTDTVYGFAASAFNIEAQRTVYRLKGRSYRKPLVIMPPDITAARHLAETGRDGLKLMKEFWPGALTLILPATALGRIVMGGRQDLGLRIPDAPVVLQLLAQCRFPLATTSANPSSKPSAKTGAEAMKYFDGKVDLVLDAGRCDIGKESTVIDMIKFPYVVLREGCFPSKKLLAHI
jgi:L-threonylcarbamoyladenylate synthase